MENSVLYYKLDVVCPEGVEELMHRLADKLGLGKIDTIATAVSAGIGGPYVGGGFVWVSSPELYHALLGRNLDGTTRLAERSTDDHDTAAYIARMSISEPSPSLSQPSPSSSVWTGGSWADEDWLDEEPEQLPSLIDDEWLYVWCRNDEEKVTAIVEPDPKNVPPRLDPDILKTDFPDRIAGNILTGSQIDSIRKQLTDYVRRLVRPVVGSDETGRRVTYPIIERPNEYTFRVKFRPRTRDAELALNILKVTYVDVPGIGQAPLVFGNAPRVGDRGGRGGGRGGRGGDRGGRGGDRGGVGRTRGRDNYDEGGFRQRGGKGRRY